MRKCRSEALEEVGRGGLGIGTGGNRTGSVARGTSDVNHVGVVEGETGVAGSMQHSSSGAACRGRGDATQTLTSK